MTLTAPDPTATALEHVTARWCAPGAEPVEVPPEQVRRQPGGVWWVDVTGAADRDALTALLRRLHEGLDDAAVDDLLERDQEAKVDDSFPGLRNVSIVGVEPVNDVSAVGGHLVFQMVEALVGEGWIVTCWQPSERVSCEGSVDGSPILREATVAAVAAAWADGGRTASDLGTLVVHSLAKRYKRTPRALERWLQRWETQFSTTDGRPSTLPLKQLLALVIEARRRLAAFNHTRCQTDNGRWFPVPVDDELDERADSSLDRVLAELQLVFDNIRADMELVTMDEMRALALDAKESGKAERDFEKKLGKVTALLLVPTLITGFFGANTRLPGGGNWRGFEVMVALMLVTSLSVYLLMVRSFKDEQE